MCTFVLTMSSTSSSSFETEKGSAVSSTRLPPPLENLLNSRIWGMGGGGGETLSIPIIILETNQLSTPGAPRHCWRSARESAEDAGAAASKNETQM